jgi:hypothetical protein
VALLDIEGGDLAAGGYSPAGELLTGNIGSLRECQLLKALRAPCGPVLIAAYLQHGKLLERDCTRQPLGSRNRLLYLRLSSLRFTLCTVDARSLVSPSDSPVDIRSLAWVRRRSSGPDSTPTADSDAGGGGQGVLATGPTPVRGCYKHRHTGSDPASGLQAHGFEIPT